MTTLGYEHRGANGDDESRSYFVRNDVHGVREAQVHLHVFPAPAWRDLLTFRDARQDDHVLAATYAAETNHVAEAVQRDKRAYSVATGPFVQQALLTILLRR